jgi:PAS domain S-box-containing protein
MLENLIRYFDFTSIVGRIRLVTLAFAMLLGFLCFYFTFNIYTIFTNTGKLQSEIRAIEYTSNQLIASLNSAFSSINLFVIYPHEIHRNKTIDTYRNETLPLLESLKEMSENEDLDPHVKTQINEIEDFFDKINDVFTNQINTLDRVSLKNVLSNVLLYNINMINKRAKNLALTHRQKEEYELKRLESKLNSLVWTIAAFFLTSVVLLLSGSYNSVQAVNKSLDSLKKYSEELKKGNIPVIRSHRKNEFDLLISDIAVLSDNLSEMRNYMLRVAEEGFDAEIKGFDEKSEIGEALHLLKKRLLEAKAGEMQREWENKGINLLSKTIREHPNNIQSLCDHLLEDLVAYSGCVQGGIFVHKQGTETLELRSCFAFGRKKFHAKETEVGEGIIGEVFRDGETVIITDVPPNYFEITSGLGKADPKCLAIVPLKTQDITVGVMELASFEDFEVQHIVLFERVAEVLASSIATVAAAEQTKLLLDEARENALRMNAQEEELRQNTEELLATREDLEKQVMELHAKIAENELILDQIKIVYILCDVSGRIVTCNQAFEDIFGYDKAETVEMPLYKVLPEIKGLNRISRDDAKRYRLNPFKGVKKDGSVLNLQANVSRIDYLSEQRFVVLVANALPVAVSQV